MRLIDADAAIYAITVASRGDSKDVIRNLVIRFLLASPTVDAVPVIRCKDCKFLRFTGTVWKCQNRLVMMLCEPNDFCSRAERRNNVTVD